MNPNTQNSPNTIARSVTICLFACLGSLVPQAAQADAVTDWNVRAGRAAVAACLSPGGNGLAEARMYPMVHVAIHDALNAIERRSRPYAFDEHVSSAASTAAAAAAAARDVLVSVIGELQESPQCILAGLNTVEADYAAALAAIPDGVAETDGIAVGRAAAAAIVALRASDGSNQPLQDFAYPQGTAPGEYRLLRDRAAFCFCALVGHGHAVRAQPQLAVPSETAVDVSSKKYAADFNEIKALGSDTSSARTADQTEIGYFWDESSPLAWNRIARTVSASRGLDLWENARLFGLLNLSMADGYIGSWEAKYHYNYWRPVTAIRLAASDGNPDTEANPTWTPLLVTSPSPITPQGTRFKVVPRQSL